MLCGLRFLVARRFRQSAELPPHLICRNSAADDPVMLLLSHLKCEHICHGPEIKARLGKTTKAAALRNQAFVKEFCEIYSHLKGIFGKVYFLRLVIFDMTILTRARLRVTK